MPTDVTTTPKHNWEEMNFNTYGIEIEFGTHDNQMLSFTHIEVAHLIPKNGNENGNESTAWKIETDADYTLELVSPILTFSSAEYARTFRNDVMCFLEYKVREGIKLGDLLKDLVSWLGTRRDLNDEKKHVTIQWITNDQLRDSLDWFNWDEDTDLERVLASKRLLPENDGNPDILAHTTVTKSRKHGGLPSSQMNVPLSFYNYIRYLRDKLYQAEDRLQNERYTMPHYRERLLSKLRERYNDGSYSIVPGHNIFTDKVWTEKFTNSDYIDEQLDSKTPIWHRYWLWLSTFVTCRRAFANNPNDLNNAVDVSTLLYQTITAKCRKYMENQGNAQQVVRPGSECLSKLIDLSRRTLPFNQQNDIGLHDVYQFILMKLITGAMSELSEVRQGALQKIVMNAKGQISMDDLIKTEPNAEFLQFHYALKDLTPLWFKSTLLETMNSEPLLRQHFLTILRKWREHEDQVSKTVENVLKTQFAMLGFYHAYTNSLNQGFDYDWDEFKAYNLPSIGTLMRQFNLGLKSLTSLLVEGEIVKGEIVEGEIVEGEIVEGEIVEGEIAEGEKLWNTVYSRYQRDYLLADDDAKLRFLERSFKNKTVAPWEGRFDTMKKPISQDVGYLYLVEHRNN